MNRYVTLVTGGSRSGKSRFARELAEGISDRRIFVATCPAVDREMQARIERHRQARAGKGWDTVEEELDLAGALHRLSGDAVLLVDCLTLWINNLLYEAEQMGQTVEETEVQERCADLLEAARARAGFVIFVTNEVGMGVVPDNPLARRFRDLAGRCNQEMATGADRVVLMVSGLPVEVKSNGCA